MIYQENEFSNLKWDGTKLPMPMSGNFLSQDSMNFEKLNDKTW